MTYHLKMTMKALDLLSANAQWYAEQSQSRELAIAWYDGFVKRIESLEKDPFAGRLASESSDFDFELRQINYGSGKRPTHRALYRIVGNTVEVLLIRHLAQQPLRPGDI